MINRIITIFICIISPLLALAQGGIVTGRVASEDGRNITEARVYVTGKKDTVLTDMDGKYALRLPVGSYLINFENEKYGTYSDSVKITEGAEVFLNVTLNNAKQIGTIGITVNRKTKDNTVAGAIQAQKIATQTVSVITAEDFQKTTIRTTSDAIKRIPGATIMDGKFANIRGMFDRYNAGYLNGAPLPSTESDRKAFSFDIIPASLLDNIVVIKSGTPDLTGDFGGGIIRINTKNIPEKLTQSLNIGIQYNSITSFRNVQVFPSSTSEYFGIPSNNRNIPNIGNALYNVQPEINARESQKFNNNWAIRTVRPMPTPRFNYTIGAPFKLGKQRELGLLFSLNYGVTQKYSDGTVNTMDYGDNHLRSSYNDKLFTSNVQNGGILNLSFKMNNRNRIDWKNLYTINYDAGSTLRKGISDYDNQVSSDGYSNLVNYNRLASTQLNGTHILGKNQTTVTWLMNYGNTHRQIPDFRIAQYASFDDGSGQTNRLLVFNDFFNAGSGRFFSDLNEKTFSGSAEVKHSIQTGKLQNNLKYGVFTQYRQRVFTSRQFVYGPNTKYIYSNATPEQDLSQDKISANNIFLIEKTNTALSEYRGESRLNAAFVMMEHHYPLFTRNAKPYNVRVIYGVRFEQYSQILKNAYFDKIHRYLANPGATNDFLPSLNIIAPVTTKSNLRMAYYKTVNRPEMRELAPFSFYNFNLNSEVVGNQQLQRAILHNFDVRYEIYPKGKEDMISLGAFAKRIINPIEFALDPSQSQIRTFTYNNEKSAEIRGLEFEVRKSLSFIYKLSGMGLFRYLNLYGNFALIHSAVQFNGANVGVQNRSLQGQSPYVVNASLFYENKNGWICNINFNKIGSRIAYVGAPRNVQPYGGDIYEFGRSILDMQVGKNFSKTGNIKLTIGDIFAQKTLFYQDLNNNHKFDKNKDNSLFSFTNGRTITISYGYTF